MRSITLLAALLCCVLATEPAAEPATGTGGGGTDLTLSIKPEFTSGDYGTGTRTRVWETPLELKFQHKGHGIGLRIPYVLESGKQPVVPGIGPVGDAFDQSFQRKGIGNVRLSAWTRFWEDEDTGATLGATVKVTPPAIRALQPMGVDFTRIGLELNASVPLPENFLLDVSLGRRFIIGAPGYGLNDYWFGSFDLSYDLTSRVTVGMTLDVQTRSSSSGTPVLEIGPWVEYDLADGWRIGAYVFRGFTRDSAAFGGGFTLSRRFGI